MLNYIFLPFKNLINNQDIRFKIERIAKDIKTPMNKQIDTLKKVRNFLLTSISELSVEQLNKIPAGFNNNIAWNLGHLVATLEGICYKRGGLTANISEEFWEKFRSGSKPEGDLSAEEIENIKTLFANNADQLAIDYDQQLFGGYASWSTRFGVVIDNIDDALQFLLFHEGLHAGAIGTLKRLV